MGVSWFIFILAKVKSIQIFQYRYNKTLNCKYIIQALFLCSWLSHVHVVILCNELIHYTLSYKFSSQSWTQCWPFWRNLYHTKLLLNFKLLIFSLLCLCKVALSRACQYLVRLFRTLVFNAYQCRIWFTFHFFLQVLLLVLVYRRTRVWRTKLSFFGVRTT